MVWKICGFGCMKKRIFFCFCFGGVDKNNKSSFFPSIFLFFIFDFLWLHQAVVRSRGSTYIYIYVYTYTYTHMYTYITYIDMDMYVRIYRCMHMYRHIYIGGWGSESNREIVFVSFVRACERAGEARRSCVRARGDVASVAGFRDPE